MGSFFSQEVKKLKEVKKSNSTEGVTMKTLALLAFVGFVFAVGLSVPVAEDELEEARNAELTDITDEFEPENPKRYADLLTYSLPC